MEEPRHTQVDPAFASDLALTEAGRQTDTLVRESRWEFGSPSPSRRLVLVSDARATTDMVHETQHDSESEDEFPIVNNSSQSQQVVVALADLGTSRHVGRCSGHKQRQIPRVVERRG